MTKLGKINFTNQNLRNQSFQGRDLCGADFTGADIRGCDFRGAKLRGANFTGVKAGVSRGRVWGLIVRCGGVAIAVTLAGAFGRIWGLVATGLVAIAICRGETGIIAATIAGMSAYVGCSGLLIFLDGDFTRGFLLGMSSMVVFGIAALMFLEVMKEMEKLTVTSFEDADVTDAIFDRTLREEANLFGLKL